MTRATTRTLAGFGVLAILILLAWSLAGNPTSSEAAETADGTIGGKAARTPSSSKPGAKSRVPTTQGARLHVKVQDRAGKALPGRLVWIASSEHPDYLDPLLVELQGSLPEAAQTIEHQGAVDLSISPNSWVWLRALGKDAMGLSRYARIAPFSGDQELDIVMDPERKGIHALVFKRDLSSRLAGADVKLFFRDMKTGGPPTQVAAAATDAHGYVVFRDLKEGSYSLCGPQAAPLDPPPKTQRVIFPPTLPRLEVPVTLVASARSQVLEIELQAQWKRRLSVAPKLFLRPIDYQGELIPMPGVIQKGHQQVRFHVPEGQYELDLLPLGSLSLQCNPEILDTRKKGRAEALIWDGNTETEIRLHGVGTYNLPVHVHPLYEDSWRMRDSESLFLGRYHWRKLQQKVRGPKGKMRLLVSRQKQMYWLSRDLVAVKGPVLDVGLVRATRIEVHWLRRPGVDRDPFWIEITTSQGKQTVPCYPTLLPYQGQMKPGYKAVLFVPVGNWRLRCFDSGVAKALWERDVKCALARVTVLVTSSGGTVEAK